jgi:fructosamine-3-kinase
MIAGQLKTHLEEQFKFKIASAQPMSGGDINAVYLLSTQENAFVLKVNKAERFPRMFEKEANGLKALEDTKAIDVPEVLGFGDCKSNTYLLMEHKASCTIKTGFWERFGEQLATMHKNTRLNFGFDEDNYIGSLLQNNQPEDSASAFYIQQRLMPQFKMAIDNGYEFKHLDTFYKQVERLIPNEPPALIHGDLWSGNYLVNQNSEPCLIDPAVAFASREMDLAMMKLSGGFDEVLFKAYNEVFPLEHAWEDRISLWQLYYILVHVNLFGGHYYSRAKEIMSHYC